MNETNFISQLCVHDLNTKLEAERENVILLPYRSALCESETLKVQRVA